MLVELIQSTEDILFVVTAGCIAVLTIMISLLCYETMRFIERLRAVTMNIEETTDHINHLIKPANMISTIISKVTSLLPLIMDGGKKKKSKKSSDE